MNTAPKPDDKPTADRALAEFERELDKEPAPTRLQAMRDEDKPIPLPDCPAPHLVEWLMQIGPVLGTGMGAVSISHRDIAAWSANVAIPLEPWQALLLRELSQEWLGMSAEAVKPSCPAPYETEQVVVDRRKVVSRGLRDIFRPIIEARGERASGSESRDARAADRRRRRSPEEGHERDAAGRGQRHG